MWLLLGLLIGAAVGAAAGVLELLHAPLLGSLSAVSDTASGLLTQALDAAGLHGDGVTAAAAVAGVLAPSLVCMMLAEAVRASKSVRTCGVVLFIGVALASFLVLPGADAIVVLVLAVLFSLLLAIARGAFLVTPLTSAITATTWVTVDDLLHGAHRLDAAAAALSGTAGASASLWTAALAVVALLPLSGAFGILLRRR